MSVDREPVDVAALGPPIVPLLLDAVRERAAVLEPAAVDYAQLTVLLEATRTANAIATADDAFPVIVASEATARGTAGRKRA